MDIAYVQGSIEEPLLVETIGNKFSSIVAQNPGRIAVQTACAQLTYKQLDKWSDALALALSGLGIQPYERIAACLGNLEEYVVVIYACAKLGVTLVPLNPAYSSVQMIAALNHISASCVVFSSEVSLPFKAPLPSTGIINEIVGNRTGEKCSTRVPSLNHILMIDNSKGVLDRDAFPGATWYGNAIAKYKSQTFVQDNSLRPTDVINIQFTSGTTSSPKAACLSHINILNNAHLVGKSMELSQEDVICCAPPLFHCFGIVLGVLAAMTHGCTLLLPSESFSPKDVINAVIKYKATALYGVPTMFLAELDELSQRPRKDATFSTLRTGLIGGSIIAPALRLRLQNDMNSPSLLNIYGMTEASPVACMTRLHDEADTHYYTVGSVLPHTEIKIVSRENLHQTVLRGERGELLISGYSVMKGYWEDEEKTSEALIAEPKSSSTVPASYHSPGKIWLRSGDEAVMRTDGTIEITGRIKDIIIRGGENIYPSEIENSLLQHGSVSSMAVVGLPDDRYGEVVSAFVVTQENVAVSCEQDPLSIDLRSGTGDKLVDGVASQGNVLTADDVRAWVRKSLSRNCTPKYVFWLNRMPLTASGKIEKYKLRAMGQSAVSERDERHNLPIKTRERNSLLDYLVKLPKMTVRMTAGWVHTVASNVRMVVLVVATGSMRWARGSGSKT